MIVTTREVIRPRVVEDTVATTAVGSDRGSPWDAVRKRTLRVMNTAERVGSEPTVVTRAIRRAVVARRPRARYVAPRRDGWVVALLNALPTSVLDWAMSRVFALYRVGTAAEQRAAA